MKVTTWNCDICGGELSGDGWEIDDGQEDHDPKETTHMECRTRLIDMVLRETLNPVLIRRKRYEQ